MIRLDRDPAFWDRVATHAAVDPHVNFGQRVNPALFIHEPAVTPLRSEHGGVIFFRLDGLGRVHEQHWMFTPEGWGREASDALKHALRHIFEAGAEIVTTYEVEGWWRSRPPLSFGYRPVGPFKPAAILGTGARSWLLTREAWEKSPARRRMR